MVGAPNTVFTVITKLSMGGAQETALRACAGLDPQRWRAVLVTGPDRSPEGDMFDQAAAWGVAVETVPTLHRRIHPVSDVRTLVHLIRLFRRERPAIVHTHSSKAGLLGRLAARMSGVGVIVHTVHGWSFHDGMSPWVRRPVIWVERLAARATSALVVVGERDREIGRREHIGALDQYRLVRSGIDVSAYRLPVGRRNDTRQALGLPEAGAVVGTVTRIAPQKDPMTLVAAFRRIVDAHPGTCCVVVGDGPMRSELEAEIDRLGLAESVVLLGPRSDVAEIMGVFDVFVISSRWEGLPRVVTEAMAAGVPVVSTRVGSIDELVEDGVTGLLAPAGDPEALAATVIRLLGEPDLAEEIARKASERVAEFDVGKMVTDLESVYVDLLEATRSRPRRRRMARTVSKA